VRGEGGAEGRRASRLAIPPYARHIGLMLDENLTLDERAAVIKLLRDTIAADRFPLSPRVRRLKSALEKLDPSAVPQRSEPLPPPKAWVNSAIGQRKRRR
jgi:hypothetical protein